MEMYDLYKPFRNEIRKMALGPSLVRLWEYHRRVAWSGWLTLRPGTEIPVWNLHLLCRELVLNAARVGGENTLSTDNGLIRMVNHIRRINAGISDRTVASGNDALIAMHPLVHQQAPWQFIRDEPRMFRAFHVYNHPELAPIFEKATGLSVREMFVLAFAIGGMTKRQPGTNAAQDYSGFDVAPEARDAFFRMTSASLGDIRNALNERQRYDECWEFTWNALQGFPLISVDHGKTSRLWCPLPDFLLRRISEGLFYDLVKSGIPFGNEYGRAFERYAGLLLHEMFEGEKFSVSGEQPYTVGKQLKHGVDWIVSDPTGNLFIECKTRRISQEAKEVGESEALDESLDELAKAVVQLYKNIDDAVRGVSKWVPNGLPIYPLVVTYEDWYLFTPVVITYLLESVRRRLEEAQLPKYLTESMPFLVASSAEFEEAGQDIANFGIQRYCSALADSEYRHFQLRTFAQTKFPNEPLVRRRLLGNTWDEIFPKMQKWSGMAQMKKAWWTQPAGG